MSVYYSPTGSPATSSTGSSAVMRNEFDLISAGFDMLPSKSLIDQGRITYAEDSGAVNAYLAALPQTLSAYTAGLTIWIKIAHTNTGASTINVDSLGAKSIKRMDGTDVAAGDLIAGAIQELSYDGTNFLLTSVATSQTGYSLITGGGTIGGNLSVTGTLSTTGNISTTAKLGVGMTPINILDITQSQNGQSNVSVLNSNSGGSASSAFIARNGTSTVQIVQLGTTGGSSISAIGSGYVYSEKQLGLISNTGTVTLVAGGASTNQVTLKTDGTLLIGTTTAISSAHTIIKATLTDDNGEIVAAITGATTTSAAKFYAVSASGANAANAALSLGKDNTTSRSINAGGTINASGAGGYEFRLKSSNCGNIAKGAIVGFDGDNKIVDKWSMAVGGFGVKSTDPGIGLGGIKWGTSETIGEQPTLAPRRETITNFSDDMDDQGNRIIESVEPGETDEEFAQRRAAYEADLADWKQRLEEERQTVDRIEMVGGTYIRLPPCAPKDTALVSYQEPRLRSWVVPAEGEGDTITWVFIPEDEMDNFPRSFERRSVAIIRTLQTAEWRDTKGIVVHPAGTPFGDVKIGA